MSPVKNPSPSNRLPASGRLDPTSRRGALVLLVGAVLLFGFRLGHLDFWAPDEPRYGAIAEELRSFRHGASGLVLLHLNDTPYTQKPPLYFWLAAAAGSPGGFVSEWAARLPSAAAGVVCVVLTAWIGRRLLGHPTVALLAAGILATSFRFVFTARRAQLDVLLTSFELIAIALFVFIEFRQAPPDPNPTPDPNPATSLAPPPARIEPVPSPWALIGLHSALGAAALVKGPVGWLPLAIIAAYLGWEGRFRSFRAYVPAWSLALSIAPVALWIAGAIALAPAGFAEIAVTENLVGRFFSGTSHARPVYYFLFQLPADFMPWTLILPFGLWSAWQALRRPAAAADSAWTPEKKSTFRFLLTWIAVPLLFFSLSAGKRGVYLLPVFPGLALLTAIGAVRLSSSGETKPGNARRTWLALGVVAALELGLFAFAAPLLESEKSPRPIAQTIRRESDSTESIGVFGLEPIEGAIAYYGDRRVVSIEGEAELHAFLDAPNTRRLVLLRSRHFDSLGPALGLERIARFRSPPRELVLAVRKGTHPTGNRRSPAPGPMPAGRH